MYSMRRSKHFYCLLLLFLLGCSSNSPGIVRVDLSLDVAAPRVGEQVVLLAKVDSQEKVRKVGFYAGSRLLGSDALAPFEMNWIAEAGTNSLRAVAEGYSGILAETTLTLQVGQGDGATPLANFIMDPVDATGPAPLKVSFDASNTTDPDHEPSELTYSWNFGDGASPAAGITTNYTFSQVGEYSVVLSVRDPDGNT